MKKAPAVSRGGLGRIDRARPYGARCSRIASESAVEPPRLVAPKSEFVTTIRPACGLVLGNRLHCWTDRLPVWLNGTTSPSAGWIEPVNSSPPGVMLKGPRKSELPPKYHDVA